DRVPVDRNIDAIETRAIVVDDECQLGLTGRDSSVVVGATPDRRAVVVGAEPESVDASPAGDIDDGRDVLGRAVCSRGRTEAAGKIVLDRTRTGRFGQPGVPGGDHGARVDALDRRRLEPPALV